MNGCKIDWDSISVPGQRRVKKIRGAESMPKWPWRMIVCGPTGCGKTRVVLDMITSMLEIDNLIVIAKSVAEDDYQKLQQLWCPYKTEAREETIKRTEEYNEKILEDGGDESDTMPVPVPFTCKFSSDLSDFPTMQEMFKTNWPDTQTLVVVDDMVTEANQECIKQFIIACRKVNTSIIYITQDYYLTPTTIRKQASSVVLFGPVSKKSARFLSEDMGGGWTSDEFWAVVQAATADKYSFLYIDESAPLELRYRKGFDLQLRSVDEVNE